MLFGFGFAFMLNPLNFAVIDENGEKLPGKLLL